MIFLRNIRLVVFFVISFGCTMGHALGDVIVLIGASSSGKTSICRELQKHKDNLVVVSYDNAIYNAIGNFFKKQIQKKYPMLEDIAFPKDNPNALEMSLKNLKKILGKKSFDELEASVYENFESFAGPIGDEIVQVTSNALASGKDVIMDIFLEPNEDEEGMWGDLSRRFRKLLNQFSKTYSIKYVCVYCPLQLLPERVRKRNAQLDHPEENRTLSLSLKTFVKMFKKQERDDEKIIDTLSRKDFYDTCAQISKCGGDRAIEKAEEERTRKMMEALGQEYFVADNVISIVPRLAYDHVVNTEKLSAQEAAAQIQALYSSVEV